MRVRAEVCEVTPAGAQAISQFDSSFASCTGRWPLPAEPQPEPMMTLPRTAAQVLSGHVRLEIRCIDRMLLTFRQPRLQYGAGIHGFFCHHRGNLFVSSALMHPMTEMFTAGIHHYIAARDLDLVHFAKGQREDEVA